MKILAINGSYRGERGHTQHLIERLFAGARQGGAQCESVTLAKLKINRCTGCDTCQKNARPIPGDANGPDYEIACVHRDRDDAQMVFDKMAEADLILYATPVYVFNISVLLKTLFDRFYGLGCASGLRVTRGGLLFHHVNHKVMSKPFVALIVCDNLENDTPATLVRYFKTFAKFLEAPMVGMLVRNGGLLAGYGNDPEAQKRLPALSKVYEAYHQAGYELAIRGRISRATQNKANQEIVPAPFFGLLKRIRIRQVKEKFVERAADMLPGSKTR
jgi:multimeric flavodoxin WrbA